jgi:glycogen debranching enzyme
VTLSGLSSAAAQEPGLAVPRFRIAGSPIALTHDVRPQQYLGVIGRRAAWLGQETGAAELWVHPIELVNGFELSFRVPDYVDPVPGRNVARTVTVRPELTTITYTHATFTIAQHILAPLDEPGLLVLLDVSTFRPLEIIVEFQMVFQYAWPAAFGGQYAFWDDGVKGFMLSESLRRRNAVIGSPWAAAASTHPAHALPDAPNTIVIPVDSARAAREFVPIAVFASETPRDSAVAGYRRLLSRARELYEERRAHVASLLSSTTELDTPDEALDLAFDWARVNLDESLACGPGLGCGLVAGFGPSGRSARPGFGWFFGGDAAINSLAMDATAMWTPVATGLEFLARYQRDDGKIPHEISQAAAHIPWFTEFPYTYYHADTTPYWIVAVWRYWRASGDRALVSRLWPAVRQAFAWGLTRDTDGDGLIENGPGDLGAIEVGELGEGIHQDIYLAAVWLEALAALAELGTAVGDSTVPRTASRLRATGLETLRERYWREREGHHAFGILKSGGTNDNLTVWPATAGAFGLLDAPRARRTLTKLAADSISADWGARILSTGSPLYDPMHYNNGAVWPFVTGFVAWAQYAYRRPWAGFPLIDAVKQMTFDWSRGRHPELLSGSYYRPLDTAVPQQFFATSMMISPILAGMWGWEPDAPRRRARLAPQLPPDWETAGIKRLRVGETSLDVTIAQEPGRTGATVLRHGPPVTLSLELAAPPGHVAVRLDASHAGAVEERRDDASGEALVSWTGDLRDTLTWVTLQWGGGLSVEPPRVDLVPGQTSRGIRILDFVAEAGGWRLTVEGERGHTYHLRLHGQSDLAAEGAVARSAGGGVTTLEVIFEPGSGRQVREIRLRR